MSKKHITKNIVTSSVSEFQRLEIKYLISNNIVDILIPDLLQHLEYDSYSINGEYDIFSVYFDTQDLQAFEAKMAGNNKRQKFRIRSYYPNPDPDENVFIEIKEKNNNSVFKRRAPLAMKHVEGLMNGQWLDNQNPVYDEWRYALVRNALKPVLMNSYQRSAFVSEHFPGLRITIDKNIRYTMTHEVAFDLPTRSVNWAHDYSVIEIKFDRYMPHFVDYLVKRYNLTSQPVSKYCDSVISHYLLI